MYFSKNWTGLNNILIIDIESFESFEKSVLQTFAQLRFQISVKECACPHEFACVPDIFLRDSNKEFGFYAQIFTSEQKIT